MRNKIRVALTGLLTVILIACLLSGCLKDHITKSYTIYRPVYTSTTKVLASINGNPTQSIGKAGKIYTVGSYIFLNDLDKGIHIYDNSDPAHPIQTAYLNIPGNEDMAVKGNILYADMYGDLLAIDISDLHHAAVTSILHNIFQGRANLNGTVVFLDGNLVDSNSVITSWIVKDTTFAVGDPGKPGTLIPNYPGPGGIYFSAAASSASGSGSGAKGVAGSMAKMVLMNDYLYALTESHSLGIIDVKNPANPSNIAVQFAGLDLETIYPFQNELFLGSAEGVYIYDLSDPISPVKKGLFTHGTACDPVIADADYAYVTLHSGTSCGGASNELDVVPLGGLVGTGSATVYQMTSPKGLCKDGNLLFVCDGNTGVKVYDATDPLHLRLANTIAGVSGNDVIAGDHLLLLVATQGLYQYSYTDKGQASQLSFLPIKP